MSDDSPVEGQARLRTVPDDELIEGVLLPSPILVGSKLEQVLILSEADKDKSPKVNCGAPEVQLDGLYVIRTSEPEPAMSAPDAVRHYKSLAQVEQAFCCLKGVDQRIRPIYHRTEDHARAHIFLCLLASLLRRSERTQRSPLMMHGSRFDGILRLREAPLDITE